MSALRQERPAAACPAARSSYNLNHVTKQGGVGLEVLLADFSSSLVTVLDIFDHFAVRVKSHAARPQFPPRVPVYHLFKFMLGCGIALCQTWDEKAVIVMFCLSRLPPFFFLQSCF